jgi:uncharacterized protein (DUF983 family)
MAENNRPVPRLLAAAIGCCPRCGRGRLFKNVLELRAACEICSLDYTFIDTGDGPAVFAIFILGLLALGGAVVMHLRFGVPLWVTYAFWGVATPLLALIILRLLKSGLIAIQFRHKAEEGRLAKD